MVGNEVDGGGLVGCNVVWGGWVILIGFYSLRLLSCVYVDGGGGG